jgi:hypothetical protein
MANGEGIGALDLAIEPSWFTTGSRNIWPTESGEPIVKPL